jgi:geranylgeranyl diphosphate synthase, type I
MKVSSNRDELESNASDIKEFIISILKGEPNELYNASAHYITTGGNHVKCLEAIQKGLCLQL